MKAYTVSDLREKTDVVIRNAERGHLSIVTKQGRPVFVVLPLDKELLQYGIHMAMAIHLYREGSISLGKAAQLSDIALESFIEKISRLDIPIVDYSKKELDEELTSLEKHRR